MFGCLGGLLHCLDFLSGIGYSFLQRFSTRDELITKNSAIMQNLGEEFYRNGIQNLVTQYNKCLDCEGD